MRSVEATASPIVLPVTGTVSRPHPRAIPSTSEPGAGKRCAPWLTQYSPQGSERMRPPRRSPASSSRTSRWRSRQAADSPAIPPPTMTTSRVIQPSSAAPLHQGSLDFLVEPKAELLSLQQIRCFCAALELGSFTAAAEALRVSQPAVAEQVRKLEQTFGADLFVRVGRGVVPTDAGRAFAEHATRTLRAVEDAADSVGELTALRSGTVAVGIFGEPSAWRVDELVAAFLRCRPDVSVRLVGRNSSAIVERVQRGELEAGIVLLPIDDDKLDVRPIVRDEVLYVSASPERTRRPPTIERLAATPLVFYDAESGDQDPIRRDPIAGADAERVGEGGLDHHAALAQPAALGQLGLVDGGRCGVAALYPGVQRVAVCLELGPGDRVRSAVTGDAGSAYQCLQAGEVGGHAAVRGRGDACDHIGPGRRGSRGLVWLARGLAQAKPERQRRGRGRDRQEEERGLRRAPAQVSRGEAADEQEAAHGFSPRVRPARRVPRCCRGSAGSPRRRRRRAWRSAGRRWPQSGRRG